MFKEIEIKINKKVYIITQCHYRPFKEILKEFKKFILHCLKEEELKEKEKTKIVYILFGDNFRIEKVDLIEKGYKNCRDYMRDFSTFRTTSRLCFRTKKEAEKIKSEFVCKKSKQKQT